MTAMLLSHFKAIFSRIWMNITRVRSARDHSQQCTTAEVKYGHSRVRCGTADSRWWNFMSIEFNCTCNDAYYGSLQVIILMKASRNCIFGVRCMPVHSNHELSKLPLQIALKWCVWQLTSDWYNLLDECCWVAGWWCVVKLTRNKCSQSACVLDWCVLRLTQIYKINVCKWNCSEMKCTAAHFQMIVLIHGIWYVAWIASDEACLRSFPHS